MQKEFLDLIPKRFLCPHCGGWHEWPSSRNLGWFDNCNNSIELVCDCGSTFDRYEVYFNSHTMFFIIDSSCYELDDNQLNNRKIEISDIIESETLPIVTFEVPFKCDEEISDCNCESCETRNVCNFLNLKTKNESNDIMLKLGFEFEQEDYETISSVFCEACKEREREKKVKIDERILNLNIKEIYCPICGEFEVPYNSREIHHRCGFWEIELKLNEDGIDIESDNICSAKVNDSLWRKIPWYDMEFGYHEGDPIIKFSTELYPDEEVCTRTCSKCMVCNLPRIGDRYTYEKYDYELGLAFMLKFDKAEFERYFPESIKVAKGKKSTSTNVRQRAQKTKEAKHINSLVREEKTMNNNFLNQTFEFGVNTDKNIVSTLMGIAVNNGESWRIYDKEKEEITDVGDLQLGNLPIYLMPTTKLEVGDLIKDSGGNYYFVVKAENGKTQTLCAKTGEIKTVVPVKNILGLSIYTKVVAIVDSLDIGKDFNVENLAIMSAMFGGTENGAQMNQMLPIMLFKDKLGSSSDDIMKMMCMTSIMTSPLGSKAQMNQMLPIMLFKDKLGSSSDDIMKMMCMTSMMISPSGDDNQMNQILPLMFINGDSGENDDMLKFMIVACMMSASDENYGLDEEYPF